MPDPASDAAANLASRRRKMLIAGNLLLWVFEGAYAVSPIDLIPDVLPLLGWADDLLGLVIAIGFTIYTVRTIRREGLAGLKNMMTGAQQQATDAPQLTTQKSDDVPTIVDMKIDSNKDIPGYEPIAPDKIKSL